MVEAKSPCPHHTEPVIFREALSHSEGTTGFTAILIEKDYYASLILHHFFRADTPLVFKGGTCISKVYADFYRLSEDLDFVIPASENISRSWRRAKVDPLKQIFNELPIIIPGLEITDALRGHNESRQYIGCLEYPSVVMEKKERIKVEIGLREPMLSPYESRPARTIIVNPFTGKSLLPTFQVHTMALREAYAEKLRAALTRREPAIRDLFDLMYAIGKIGFDLLPLSFCSW